MSTLSKYIRRMTGAKMMTAEELLRYEPPDKRTELIRGRLILRDPGGARHGAVANEIAYRLTRFVKDHHLGRVYAAETGYWIESDPDTVRKPDVAFISRERLPGSEPAGYSKLGPDLVVEVLGADPRPGRVLAKVADWLNAGCRLVWVIDPGKRTGRVYRSDGSELQLGPEDDLDGEDVVPGFRCTVGEVFLD